MGYVDVSAVRIRDAEDPLWDDGTLVARHLVMDGLGPRVVAATHDVALTERTLRPVYGDLLAVVESRWGREVFRAIQDAVDVADAAGLVFSSGSALREDGYWRQTIGVRYITREMALALECVPEELVTVEALLTPAGTRRPPLLEDL